MPHCVYILYACIRNRKLRHRKMTKTKECRAGFVPPNLRSIVCRSADWAIKAMAWFGTKVLFMKVIHNCRDLSPFPFPFPAWRKIKNIFLDICTWAKSPINVKFLSNWQLEGKRDVWMSQVRRVNYDYDRKISYMPLPKNIYFKQSSF